MFDCEEGYLYHKAANDFLRTMGSKAGFENFLKSLYTDANGNYVGPENFNSIRRPSASQEAKNISVPAYSVMNIVLAKSLGEKTYHERWMEATKKGFNNLIAEMEEKGPNHFINKDKDDPNFKAGKGALFWDGIIKYIKFIGEKGLTQLFEKVQALPKTVSSSDIVNKRLLDVDLPTS